MADLLLVLQEVRSVLVMGPIIAAIGLTAVVLGWHARYATIALRGLADVAVCALLFLLVILCGWGPSDAQPPFAVMGSLHAVMSLPFLPRVVRRDPSIHGGAPGAGRRPIRPSSMPTTRGVAIQPIARTPGPDTPAVNPHSS